MNELVGYLKSYFFVPDNEVELLTELFTITQLEKGDYFIKRGRYGDQLSFLRSGIIRVFAEKGDKEVTQWLATPGYFLTDLRSLVFDQTARWDMQALTPCECYTITKENYRKIGTLIPNWNELEKRFLAACFITLEERVFEFLSADAETRYKRLFSEYPQLFNQVPLQYIASMLGMTPETLSRIRAKK